MLKFDYSQYEQLLSSFDFQTDTFNPRFEDIQEYIALTEDFDPINNPPQDSDKKEYIFKYIVPIMKQHAKDLRTTLTVDESDMNVVITLITDRFIVLEDDFDLKNILMYSSSFIVYALQTDKIKLEVFFDV